MKFDGTFVITLSRGGRSRKGAWIEICFVNGCAISTRNGRSRKGAWIEIAGLPPSPAAAWVAPVRERGLKFQGIPSCAGKKRGLKFLQSLGLHLSSKVAPVRERGLKCFHESYILLPMAAVAPVRERGLKLS